MSRGPEGRPLAVVLLSGGMDSAVAAAEVSLSHRLACLHATYGQRTANRERVCFGALAHHFGAVAKLVVTLTHLSAIGGSALTDPSIPVGDAPPGAGGVPPTYVPFRNAHLLAAAVSWAEVLRASAVVIGAVEEDSSGYPDCRRAFMEAFQQSIHLGTRPETHITLLAPVIGMSKAEIVLRGQKLSTPFHLTWSCYRDEGRACGTCESCRLRLRGFARAGLPDPLPYAAPDGSPARRQGASPGQDRRGAREKKIAALRAFLRRVQDGS
ncbi:MAG: 7-cyano-7-deazaguanine synthase QueC [Acidobacteriota bacterium]